MFQDSGSSMQITVSQHRNCLCLVAPTSVCALMSLPESATYAAAEIAFTLLVLYTLYIRATRCYVTLLQYHPKVLYYIHLPRAIMATAFEHCMH